MVSSSGKIVRGIYLHHIRWIMIILLSLFRRVIERFVFGYHINEACTVLDCFIIDLVEIS